jgi:diketogulonate reductase-like aldo/keto reductase
MLIWEYVKRLMFSGMWKFYWQDYSDPGYLTALHILHDLQTEGLISAIGITNFDAVRTDQICTQLGPGVILTNQVQVS